MCQFPALVEAAWGTTLRRKGHQDQFVTTPWGEHWGTPSLDLSPGAPTLGARHPVSP